MIYGVRAAAKILRTYGRQYGINTVRGVINRWAPAKENNVATYISSVTGSSGYGADQNINLQDVYVLAALLRGMFNVEVGRVASAAISDSTILEGVRLS